MEEVPIKNWHEFKEEIREKYSDGKWIFRGQANSIWGLDTTLEREGKFLTLKNYYLKSLKALPYIESYIGKKWPNLPDVNWIKEVSRDDLFGDFAGAQLMVADKKPLTSVFEFFAYLRHHGFPSPLLDWTHSPYVAAFFAFDQVPLNDENVAIYALKSDISFGIYVAPKRLTAHPRHYKQQSRYTISTSTKDDDYQFIQHDENYALKNEDDIVKFLIPQSQRNEVLSDLALMNINSYSLFGSEEALMRTVAREDDLLR